MWLEVEKLLGLWEGTKPHRWIRYIDDILFFWRSSEEELLKFLEHLNAQHPFIKFTATYNTTTKSVPFLDTQVSINESGLIETDLYKKSSAKGSRVLLDAGGEFYMQNQYSESFGRLPHAQ